jgi:hypothetical protein
MVRKKRCAIFAKGRASGSRETRFGSCPKFFDTYRGLIADWVFQPWTLSSKLLDIFGSNYGCGGSAK